MPPKHAREFLDIASPKWRSPKHYCSFSSAWKIEEFKVNIGGGNQNYKTFSGVVLLSANGDDNTFLTLYEVVFCVSRRS